VRHEADVRSSSRRRAVRAVKGLFETATALEKFLELVKQVISNSRNLWS
jgi:hypothetical protein